MKWNKYNNIFEPYLCRSTKQIPIFIEVFAKPILVSNKTRHMIPANTARAIQTTHSVDQKFAIEPW